MKLGKLLHLQTKHTNLVPMFATTPLYNVHSQYFKLEAIHQMNTVVTLDTKVVTEGEAEETDEEEEQWEEKSNYDFALATQTNVQDCGHSAATKTYKINSFAHWKLKDTNMSLKHQVQWKYQEQCKDIGQQMSKVAGMLLECQSSAASTSQKIRDTRNNLLKSTQKMHEICEFAGEAIPHCKFPA